jgi:hypothetical protein
MFLDRRNIRYLFNAISRRALLVEDKTVFIQGAEIIKKSILSQSYPFPVLRWQGISGINAAYSASRAPHLFLLARTPVKRVGGVIINF